MYGMRNHVSIHKMMQHVQKSGILHVCTHLAIDVSTYILIVQISASTYVYVCNIADDPQDKQACM